MPDLPVRVDLRQLRIQAKELLKQAREGDDAALARIEAVSGELMLTSAQLAIAREYGFPSWTRLKTEVERRELLNRRDLAGLGALLDEHPELAVESLEHWCDHRRGATPLGYMAVSGSMHQGSGCRRCRTASTQSHGCWLNAALRSRGIRTTGRRR